MEVIITEEEGGDGMGDLVGHLVIDDGDGAPDDTELLAIIVEVFSSRVTEEGAEGERRESIGAAAFGTAVDEARDACEALGTTTGSCSGTTTTTTTTT